MNSNFAAVFSQLRHDRNISQRQVAAELGISQALLSHYENGLREPRLDFVVKACEYYGVSADFILGRTQVRENPMTSGTGEGGEAGEPEGKKNDNIRHLISAIAVMFGVMADTLGDKAVENLYGYLGAAAYKLFRNVYAFTGQDAGVTLRIPEHSYPSVCDAVMSITDVRLKNSVEKAARERRLPEISRESLRRDYPALAETFEELIRRMDGEIAEYLELMDR